MPLRIPPIVNQNLAKLPDGMVDPEHADDCGESCLASAIIAIRGLHLSPGCIRAAVGSDTGLTNSGALQWFLNRIGLKTGEIAGGYPSEYRQLRHHGRYLIALGEWIAPSFEHWMLAYQSSDDTVLFMDPFTGSYTARHGDQFTTQYANQAVIVAP